MHLLIHLQSSGPASDFNWGTEFCPRTALCGHPPGKRDPRATAPVSQEARLPSVSVGEQPQVPPVEGHFLTVLEAACQREVAALGGR